MRRLLSLSAILLALGCADPQVKLITLPRPPDPSTPRAGGGDKDAYRLPDAGPAPKLNLPVPQRFDLPGGARTLIVERHVMPIVAVAVVWPFGALEDPPDRPGMASLCADMLDEGAGKRGPLELAEAISRIGARLEIRTSLNATLIELRTPGRELEAALKLLGDVVRRPQITAKELARVKADTLTRLRQRHDSPTNIAHDVLEAALYGQEHRRRAPAIGTAEAVALLDHYDCRWWHRERLRPDDAAVIVVGDVEPQRLRGLLEAELGGWRAPDKRKELPPMGKAPPPSRRILAVETPGRSQTVVQVGEPAVPRTHPDYFPLLVMNAVLGGQFHSRLMMNLREKHGWTYRAQSEFSFGRDGGPFHMGAQVKGERAKEALAEMLKEVERLRTAEVPEAELRQAKDYLARSLPGRFGTAAQIAAELSALEVFGLPENYFATFAERVEAVSAKEVRRVAQQHLDPQRMTAVLVGDRKDVERAGELGLGPVEYREPPSGAGKEK